MFGPPSSRTRGLRVLPRASTERFCETIASASEQRISLEGMPALDQVDDVRLREDAALGGNVVKLRRNPIAAGGPRRRHAGLDHALVDRGARARRALVVHRGDGALVARLVVFLKQDDLGVLATEFDHRAHVRVQMVDRHGDCVDFLNEARADRLAQRTRAGSGDERSDVLAGDVGRTPGRWRRAARASSLLPCLMPLVVGPENLFRRWIDDDGFDRGRANVDPDDDSI